MGSRLGPVFDVEMKIGARRWLAYAGRSLFVGALLAGMGSIWWSHLGERPAATIQAQARVGQAYFYAVVGVQLALTMIVAPAAAAGAVCVERSRGWLAHLLVTDLTAREIILGKLLARLLPTAALVACAWPVAALGTLLGGIGPGDLTMAFALTLAVGVVGCSLALTLSTWARTVPEVLLAVYTFWAIVLLAYPVADALSFTFNVGLTRHWMLAANPFWLAYAPYVEPGRNGLPEYGGFFGAALGLSALGLGAAIARVRVDPLGEAWPRRKAGGVGRIGRLARRLPGPSLDGNPVLWREWHRARASRPMRVALAALLLASAAACVQGAWEILAEGFHPRVGVAGVMALLVQTVFGLLALAAFASLAFVEERRRGSLDVLLATPLSTRSIVRGKFLATLRVLPLLAAGPTLVVAALGWVHPSIHWATRPWPVRQEFLTGPGRAGAAALMPLTILAHGAWVASLGLALSVRVRREGRAIGLATAASVLQSIGIPVAAIVLAGPRGNGPFSAVGPILASSPAFAALQVVDGLSVAGPTATRALRWVAAWDAVALAAALILLEATTRAFDRKFDRMPERSEAGPRRPAGPRPGQPST